MVAHLECPDIVKPLARVSRMEANKFRITDCGDSIL
jgi:hypothetical protein